MANIYDVELALQKTIDEPICFSEIRRKTIADLQLLENAAIEQYCRDFNTDIKELRKRLASIRDEIIYVATEPNWMKPRPPRRMPKAEAVAQYWRKRHKPFEVEINNPACFACGLEVNRWGDLERAHLEDRFLGGLDHAANLAMLCHSCHKIMPMFEPGTYEKAIAWVLSNPRLRLVEQILFENQIESGT